MHESPTAPVDPYHAIADLYDLEHDGFRDDIDLLLSFAEVAGEPILEMGCGSGRVLGPLAQAGYTVVGLDHSPTMLDRARTRLTDPDMAARVTLVEGDMAGDVALPDEPFTMVMFTLNALMHLPSPELQLTALTSARKRLAVEGLLVIDIVNPAPDYLVSLASAPALEWSSPLADGTVVDKWGIRQVYPVDQVIDTTLWYDQAGPAGEFHRFRTRFDLRYLHPNELKLMLCAAGFSSIHMYGSYELDPLDDASDRIVVTAEPSSTVHHIEAGH